LFDEIEELEKAIELKIARDKNNRIRVLSHCTLKELFSDLTAKKNKLKDWSDKND